MSLIPVDAEYHYLQDTAPTTANAGDVWLDTSQNPPVAKIYADVGNGLEWLQDQSSSRIETNLDAKVSNVGQGVDWSSKTPGFGGVEEGNTLSISGSGYLISITAKDPNNPFRLRDTELPALEVDGTEHISDYGGSVYLTKGSMVFLHRFESSLKVGPESENGGGVVQYVLD